MKTVGVLHPGAMGASVAAALASRGHLVLWCDDQRSQATHSRAKQAGAQSCQSLSEISERCELIVSVCPPEFAAELAQRVRDLGFSGWYLDANAISPGNCSSIEKLFPGRFIDGGIIGPPALQPGTTRLYLAGDLAREAALYFSESAVEAIVMQQPAPAASALKMAYAAWTKGSSALLLSARALAESLEVGPALESEWARSQPATTKRVAATAQGVAPKAWRFAAEMNEIADTYESVDLPRGFHDGAMQLYQTLAPFKDASEVDLSAVLKALIESNPGR